MNGFREALSAGRQLIGLWQALATPYTAEICAGSGFDWLMFDGEHAPNTLQTLLAQLQAVAAYPVLPVARVPSADPVVIKQYLDIGFQTLLVPMVETAEEAGRIVAATRFPPRGIRGVASATSRASGFGARRDYLATAHDDVMLIAQIESAAGLEAVDAIAGTEGIDALFIGPSDLAGSLGHLGDPGAAPVQSAVSHALVRIAASGKPAGIFALSADDARARLEEGCAFVSIGTDIGLIVNGAKAMFREIGRRDDE